MRSSKGSANSFSLIVDMDATLGNDSSKNAKKLIVVTQDQKAPRTTAFEGPTGQEVSWEYNRGSFFRESSFVAKKSPKLVELIFSSAPYLVSSNPKAHGAMVEDQVHGSMSGLNPDPAQVLEILFQPCLPLFLQISSPAIGLDSPVFSFGLNRFQPSSSAGQRTLGCDGKAKGKGKMGVGTKYARPNHSSSGFAASAQRAASSSVSGQPLHSEGECSWAHVTATSQSRGKTPLLFHAPEFSSDGVVVINLLISLCTKGHKKWASCLVGSFIKKKLHFPFSNENLMVRCMEDGPLVTAEQAYTVATMASRGIGKSLALDRITEDTCIRGARRIGFARVLIEVDAVRKLPKMVRVRLPIKESNETLSVNVRVEYQWRPSQCSGKGLSGAPSNQVFPPTNMAPPTPPKSPSSQSPLGWDNVVNQNPFHCLSDKYEEHHAMVSFPSTNNHPDDLADQEMHASDVESDPSSMAHCLQKNDKVLAVNGSIDGKKDGVPSSTSSPHHV
ncbi:hypothetical protein Pint_16265 [Pistacia integerrima]|uniref:Uncharacterized protein n=1 Tax=Pistacia integerrima TaxID=434235 RepID=A0ACC0ZD77_9ROSI|nr:hypothetical protein Pint_16265 [Pistacia integerrima]